MSKLHQPNKNNNVSSQYKVSFGDVFKKWELTENTFNVRWTIVYQDKQDKPGSKNTNSDYDAISISGKSTIL